VILFLAVALAAITVPLAGGSLGHLRSLRLASPALVAAALLIQIVVISVLPRSLPSMIAQLLHLASYALAVVFLVRNRKVPGLWLIGAGGLSNLIAIGANGGIMPASTTALAAAGRAAPRSGFINSRSLAHPHLAFLGDVFSIPRGFPLANVFSIGDIVLVIGAFVLLHRVGQSRLGALLAARRGVLAGA
jgi:hypothetical protein